MLPGPTDPAGRRVDARRARHVDAAIFGRAVVEVRGDWARSPAELGRLVAGVVAVRVAAGLVPEAAWAATVGDRGTALASGCSRTPLGRPGRQKSSRSRAKCTDFGSGRSGLPADIRV